MRRRDVRPIASPVAAGALPRGLGRVAARNRRSGPRAGAGLAGAAGPAARRPPLRRPLRTRDAALAALAANPRRLAAFALATDQPTAAATAIAALPDDDRARPVLAARLAWRQGRLTDAIKFLDTAPARRAGRLRAAPTRRARRLRATLLAEQSVLTGTHPRLREPGEAAPRGQTM